MLLPWQMQPQKMEEVYQEYEKCNLELQNNR